MGTTSLRNLIVLSLYRESVACREALGGERHISKMDFGEILRSWIGQPRRQARLPLLCPEAEAAVYPGSLKMTLFGEPNEQALLQVLIKMTDDSGFSRSWKEL
jgi:hypothetical protein